MTGIGLLGYGYWGKNLARNFSRIEGCTLRAICDLCPQRREEASKLYRETRIECDFQAILNNPDIQAVLVSTPVSTHYPLAKAALQAGKDVLLEKPMTQYVWQAHELLDLAKSKDLILAVDHTFVFTGEVRKIKEIVNSGELGEILYIDSVRINLGLFQNDVNVLLDLAPHDLSIASYLVDETPAYVQAMGRCVNHSSQESIVYLHLEYQSGLMAHFHLSWLAPVKVRKTLITGTRKMIVYDDLMFGESVKVYDKGVDIVADNDSAQNIRIGYRTGDMVSPKVPLREALSLMAENFVQSLTTRERPTVDGSDGLKIVSILEAAQRSLCNGSSKEKVTL